MDLPPKQKPNRGPDGHPDTVTVNHGEHCELSPPPNLQPALPRRFPRTSPPQPSILTTLNSISNSHLLSSSGTPVGSSSYLIYTSTFSPFGNGFLKIGPCEVYASHYLPSSPPARSPSPKSPRVSFFTSSWSRFLFGCNYLFVLSSFTISFILSPRGHFRASSCGPNFAFPCEGD